MSIFFVFKERKLAHGHYTYFDNNRQRVENQHVTRLRLIAYIPVCSTLNVVLSNNCSTKCAPCSFLQKGAAAQPTPREVKKRTQGPRSPRQSDRGRNWPRGPPKEGPWAKEGRSMPGGQRPRTFAWALAPDGRRGVIRAPAGAQPPPRPQARQARGGSEAEPGSAATPAPASLDRGPAAGPRAPDPAGPLPGGARARPEATSARRREGREAGAGTQPRHTAAGAARRPRPGTRAAARETPCGEGHSTGGRTNEPGRARAGANCADPAKPGAPKEAPPISPHC